MFGRWATVNTGTEGRVHGYLFISQRPAVNTRSVPAFTQASSRTPAPPRPYERYPEYRVFFGLLLIVDERNCLWLDALEGNLVAAHIT